MNRNPKSLLTILLVLMLIIGVSVIPLPNDVDNNLTASQGQIDPGSEKNNQ